MALPSPPARESTELSPIWRWTATSLNYGRERPSLCTTYLFPLLQPARVDYVQATRTREKKKKKKGRGGHQRAGAAHLVSGFNATFLGFFPRAVAQELFGLRSEDARTSNLIGPTWPADRRGKGVSWVDENSCALYLRGAPDPGAFHGVWHEALKFMGIKELHREPPSLT